MKGRVTLMHKNDKVASCYFGKGNTLTQIYAVYNESLLPVVAQKNTLVNLQKWISARFTADTRPDFESHREFYTFDSKNFSSVMDGYWIKTEKTETWDDINPHKQFQNANDEIEKLIFSPDSVANEVFDWTSPNLTLPLESESFLLKDKNKFFLLLGEPKRKMDQYKKGLEMNIPFAEREYLVYKDSLFTKVALDISESVEYIPFEEYFLICDKPKGGSHLDAIRECCKQFNIPGAEAFFDNLLEFIKEAHIPDWRISDIGVLRNSDTLEILGFHPLI